MLFFPVFAKLQPAFQSRANSLPLALRFRRPFFSSTYKRPFPQLLSFDTVTNAWGVYGGSTVVFLKYYFKFACISLRKTTIISPFSRRPFRRVGGQPRPAAQSP